MTPSGGGEVQSVFLYDKLILIGSGLYARCMTLPDYYLVLLSD